MKIKLNVGLTKKENIWNLFLEKELELDFLPGLNEEIEDNGLNFKVESRTFHLEGYVSLLMKPQFEIINDKDKKDVLKRMKESEWAYRGDPKNFDILEM